MSRENEFFFIFRVPRNCRFDGGREKRDVCEYITNSFKGRSLLVMKIMTEKTCEAGNVFS